jgi:NADH-quinone oxidoreductase subunit A
MIWPVSIFASASLWNRCEDQTSHTEAFMESTSTTQYWPFLIYVVGVVLTAGVMLGLSYILGQRHDERATREPYESGILITGSARIRYDARFYLVGIIFVVFDLETVYLYAWSVAARDLGWAGFYAVSIFSALLLVMLAYMWRSGGLNVMSAMKRLDKAKRMEWHDESLVE